MKHALFPCFRRRPCHLRFRSAAKNYRRRTRSIEQLRGLYTRSIANADPTFDNSPAPTRYSDPPLPKLSDIQIDATRRATPKTGVVAGYCNLVYHRPTRSHAPPNHRTDAVRTARVHQPRRKRLSRQHRSFQNNRSVRPNRSGWILRGRKLEGLFGTPSKAGTLSILRHKLRVVIAGCGKATARNLW